MDEIEIKRLSVNIEKSLHDSIKKVSIDRNVSMRDWIQEAIFEKIKNDMDLGFDYGFEFGEKQ